MRYVLHALSCVVAPSMPFLAEHVFQAVRESEDEESVHLARWPEGRATTNFLQRIFGGVGKDTQLLEAMSVARSMVSKALEARDSAKIKVRQPLTSLVLPTSVRLAQEYLDIIADEVNVKRITFGEDLRLDTNVTEELREEGFVRDLIRAIQAARKDAGLNPHDTAKLIIDASQEVQKLIRKYPEVTDVTKSAIEFDSVAVAKHRIGEYDVSVVVKK